MRWAYGVTSVRERVDTLLKSTLISLRIAGFPIPRLFIDDLCPEQSMILQQCFGLTVTHREPKIRTTGNWHLAMLELYHRDPAADRYALFQDDIVCCRGLLNYLENSWPNDRCYLNLYTFSTNEPIIRDQPPGWYEASTLTDGSFFHGKKQQTGRSACALVFDRNGLISLLSSEIMILKPQDPHRGWKKIDAAIVEAMNRAGYREMIHNPSLIQHLGEKSTVGNLPHQQALSFRGEKWDAMELLSHR